MNISYKLVRRELKNQREYILNLVSDVKKGINVKKNNQILMRLFDPLLKKLSLKYFKLYNLDRDMLKEFLEMESLSLFLEYDPAKNDSFPAYFKTLLDKRLWYFCQKYHRVNSFYDRNYDVDRLEEDEEDIFMEEENATVSDRFDKYFYLLSLGKTSLFRKVVYYLLFRNLKEVEVAKKLGYSYSRISQIVSEVREEVEQMEKEEVSLKGFDSSRRLIGLEHVEKWREEYFYNPIQSDFVFIDYFDISLFKRSPYNSFSFYILSKVFPFLNLAFDMLRPRNLDLAAEFVSDNGEYLSKLELSMIDSLLGEIDILRKKVSGHENVEIPIIIAKETDNKLSENYAKLVKEINDVKNQISEESMYDKKEALKQRLESLDFEKRVLDDSMKFEKKKPSYEIKYSQRDLSFLTEFLRDRANNLIKVKDALIEKKRITNDYANLIRDMNVVAREINDFAKKISDLNIYFPFKDALKKQEFTKETLKIVAADTQVLARNLLDRDINCVVFCDMPYIVENKNFYYICRR